MSGLFGNFRKSLASPSDRGSSNSEDGSSERELNLDQASENLEINEQSLSEIEDSPSVVSSVSTQAFRDAMSLLSADVLEFLTNINGQDCYDAKVAAVGKLTKAHYLKLPKGFVPARVTAGEVGVAGCVKELTPELYAQIYYLNKMVFDSGEAQVKGALLRAELVAAGWVDGKYEVEYVEVPDADEVAQALETDLPSMKEHASDAKALALLLPIAAEHTFRTMGHHYLTDMATEYTAKYTKFFQACVMPTLAGYLAPDVLYHRVAHWVSLSKALEVSRHADQASRLPNAVVIRSTAGPCGTAVITTSEAILKALDQTGLKGALVQASGVDITSLEAMSSKVKSDPGKYHTIPTAYDRSVLDPADKTALDAAKESAYMLAPVLQGFLDSLPRNSDLPQAKALIKHADVNPILRRRAKLFFKEVGATKAANMKELFAGDKRGTDVVGNTDKVSAEALEDEEE